MKRIDTASAVADLHGAGKDGFTDGNPGTQEPTLVDADWHNGVQEEILNVIEGGGGTPSGSVLTQLRDLLRKWFAGLCYRNFDAVTDAGVRAAKAVIGIADEGVWLAGGNSGDIGYSFDGYVWFDVANSMSETIRGFTRVSTTLVGVGDNAMFGRSTAVSPPSWTYTAAAGGFTGNFAAVARGTTHVVVVGETGTIQRAAIGTLNTLAAATADAGYVGDFVVVIYDASAERFLAFGTDGGIQVSDDEGATWTQVLAAGTGAWFCAATDNAGNILCGGSDPADMIYSDDAGDTWNPCASTPGTSIVSMLYDGANYVMVDDMGSGDVRVVWTPDVTLAAANTQGCQVSDAMDVYALGTRDDGADPSVSDAGGSVLAVGAPAGVDQLHVIRFLQRSVPV